jgi:hypothetical protein
MNQEQMKVIVGLIGGLEIAVIHLANVLAAHQPDAKEALASSFEKTADTVPENMAMPLRHIASGLRNSATPQVTQELHQLLGRLQRGSEPPPATGG